MFHGVQMLHGAVFQKESPLAAGGKVINTLTRKENENT
jgi:hypothetical protein